MMTRTIRDMFNQARENIAARRLERRQATRALTPAEQKREAWRRAQDETRERAQARAHQGGDR